MKKVITFFSIIAMLFIANTMANAQTTANNALLDTLQYRNIRIVRLLVRAIFLVQKLPLNLILVRQQNSFRILGTRVKTVNPLSLIRWLMP